MQMKTSPDDLIIMCKRAQSGFSLSEMCIACLIMATLAAIAIPSMSDAIRRSNADSAAQLVAQQLTYARSIAISSHQPVLVQFSSTDQSIAVAPGTGSARGPFVLPGRMEFQEAAIPPATPDSLGDVLGAAGASQIWFLDNGSAVDGLGSNNILSGTVFLERDSDDAATRRAVTLLGGTGRVHIWRYDTQTDSWK